MQVPAALSLPATAAVRVAAPVGATPAVISDLAVGGDLTVGRLLDALMAQAFRPTLLGARCNQQRADGVGHNGALRRPASRLAGILYGWLKTGTLHDQVTVWSHCGARLAT